MYIKTLGDLKALDLPDDTPILLRLENSDDTGEYVAADFTTFKLKPRTLSGIWWKLDIEGKECLVFG